MFHIMNTQVSQRQHNEDIGKVINSKNTLIKMKFNIWHQCSNYYVSDSFFCCLSKLSQKYNPYIWKIVTNDLEFNWKFKNDDDQFEYRYPVCIFCHGNWHQNVSPQQHLMESCNVVFSKINIKIRQTDNIDQNMQNGT